MKKIAVIIISLIMCAALFGCSTDQTVQKSSVTAAQSTTVKATTDNTNNSTSKSSAKAADTNDAAKNTDAAKGKKESADNTKAPSNKPAATEKKTEKESSFETTVNKNLNQSSSTEKTTVQCDVSVECKSVLKNIDKLKPGHEEYVPKNGYIIKDISVSVKKGSTVYDAVKAACASSGVKLTASAGIYGTYIIGFNNIDEKDCSAESGWVYYVNGVSPSKSCSKYTVSENDKIVFSYVVDNK